MADTVTFKGQAYERIEHAVERAVQALRVELEATREAAKRIEELVRLLKAKNRG